MAKTQPKDIFSRFADLGEEAMQKLSDVPGANKLVEMTNQSRQRIDEIQRRLRGLDVLERRVDQLEARLAKLEPKAKPKSSSSSRSKPPASKSGSASSAKKTASK